MPHTGLIACLPACQRSNIDYAIYTVDSVIINMLLLSLWTWDLAYSNQLRGLFDQEQCQ